MAPEASWARKCSSPPGPGAPEDALVQSGDERVVVADGEHLRALLLRAAAARRADLLGRHLEEPVVPQAPLDDGEPGALEVVARASSVKLVRWTSPV